MKLLIVVVNQKDARRLRDALVDAGHRFTQLGSTGGFLGESNQTLLMGIEDEQEEPLIELIAATCRSREQIANVAPPETHVFAETVGWGMQVTAGGARIFVIRLERMLAV